MSDTNHSAKVLDYVRATSVALEKAAASQKMQADYSAAVTAKQAAIAEKLVSNGWIQPGERERVAGVLADPVRMLDLCANLASQKMASADAVTAMGRPAQTVKVASELSAWDKFGAEILGAR